MTNVETCLGCNVERSAEHMASVAAKGETRKVRGAKIDPKEYGTGWPATPEEVNHPPNQALLPTVHPDPVRAIQVDMWEEAARHRKAFRKQELDRFPYLSAGSEYRPKDCIQVWLVRDLEPEWFCCNACGCLVEKGTGLVRGNVRVVYSGAVAEAAKATPNTEVYGPFRVSP